MNCPSCGSNKVKEGSDFYMCNNPHCLKIWRKPMFSLNGKDVILVQGKLKGMGDMCYIPKLKAQKAGEKSNDIAKRRSRKL